MIGSKISHYEILDKLGEGGMGVVYKAIDTILDRPVALKFISAAVTTDKTIKERLMREAKACAALNHPNITTIYEFAEADEKAFIAMEYVEGRTLQEIMAERRLGIQEVLTIAIQAVDALQAAHKKGIIHRDLKPANIMQDVAGRIKVMDFGLAKLAQASLLTISGATLGTAAYMSPEQAQGLELDHRSDIYSMGVILYHLSTGKLPFMDAHPLAVMYAILNESPTHPREINPDIPEDLERLILKAIEKEPENRYSDFLEMLDDLQGLTKLEGKKSKERTLRDDMPPGKKTKEFKTSLTKKVILAYGIPMIFVVALVIWFMINGGFQNHTTNRELAKTHEAKALQFLRRNQTDLAKEAFDKAIKADPTYSSAWSSLAALNIRQGDLNSAITQSQKAIDLEWSNSNGHYNLAYALEETGKFDSAIRSYSQAIKVDSMFTQAYSALGNLYINVKRPKGAISVLNKALRLVPVSQYNYLVYKNLGKAYYNLENYDKAVDSLERSRQVQPFEVPETIFFLAMAYESLGKKTESIQMWRRYLETETDTKKRQEANKRLQSLTY